MSTIPNAPGLTANCEVYDSEILKIEQVINALNERTYNGTKRVEYAAFDREIRDRFAAIGFKVDVAWYHSDVDGVKIPEIVIQDRIEKKDFDFDQMVNEVTNDLLGFGEGGVIKSDPTAFQAPSHDH